MCILFSINLDLLSGIFYCFRNALFVKATVLKHFKTCLAPFAFTVYISPEAFCGRSRCGPGVYKNEVDSVFCVKAKASQKCSFSL